MILSSRQDRIIRVSSEFLGHPGNNMRANRDMLLEAMARGEIDLIQVESDIPEHMLKYAPDGKTSQVVCVVGVLDRQVFDQLQVIKDMQQRYSETVSRYLDNSVDQAIHNAEIIEGVSFDDAFVVDEEGRFTLNNGLSSRFFTAQSGIVTILPPEHMDVFESSDAPTFVAFSPYYHLECLYGVSYDLVRVQDMSEKDEDNILERGKLHTLSRFQNAVPWDGSEELSDVIARIDQMPDPVENLMRNLSISVDHKTARVHHDSRDDGFAKRDIS